ncbi:MAG: hypothetical protein ACO3CV_01880 [Steroidobacteraceae bacterium]
MRVTDDRYRRDRLRVELALRLISHEARTHTIHTWTGLSDDRIRKLYRSYIRPGSGLRRHRGKSPQQVGFFLRAGGAQARALASVFLLFGLLPAKPEPAAARRLPSIARGRLLCDAFEAYRRIVPQPRIDFEHAVFLALALAAGDELRIRWCNSCEALNLAEPVTVRERQCCACEAPLVETRAGRAGPRVARRMSVLTRR